MGGIERGSGVPCETKRIDTGPCRLLEVDAESYRRYAAKLGQILREAEELQKMGRLQDEVSRWEIAVLRQQLRNLQQRGTH